MYLNTEVIFLISFVVFIVFVLMLDLLLVGRKNHVVTLREATIWSLIWISLALVFSLFIYLHGEKVHGIDSMGELEQVVQKYAPYLKLNGQNFEENLGIYRHHMTINYLTGYLIEKVLSVDNLFVMIMILSVFSVKPESYKPVLFWGILGAIILRFIFIFVGAALIQRFSWILLIFGGYLVYAGIKMYIQRNKEEKIEPQNNALVKFLSKRFRIFPRYVKNHFYIRRSKVFYFTPLFIVLIFIEFTDLIFATDSIPAIFAITCDPYVVFFSNIFAILGLRSLFFLLLHVVSLFHYLKAGVAILLVFIGVKLLCHGWLEKIGFRTEYSLYFIIFVLVASIALSLIFPKKDIETS